MLSGFYSRVRNRRLLGQICLIESVCLVKASNSRRCYKKYCCLSKTRNITSLCRIIKKNEKACEKRKSSTVLIRQLGINRLVSWRAKVFVSYWWVYSDSGSLQRKYCFIGLNVTEHLKSLLLSDFSASNKRKNLTSSQLNALNSFANCPSPKSIPFRQLHNSLTHPIFCACLHSCFHSGRKLTPPLSLTTAPTPL